MTKWFDEHRSALLSGLSSALPPELTGGQALPSARDVSAAEEGLAALQGLVRRQALDARNLLHLAKEPGSVDCRRPLYESLTAHNSNLAGEMQRMALRLDEVAVARLRREALLRHCGALCQQGAPQAQAMLVETLRAFPGEAGLLQLGRRHFGWGAGPLADHASAFQSLAEFTGSRHAGMSCICAVADGFWTGHGDGAVRRFDLRGSLLEEYQTGPQGIAALFTDARGQVWACSPAARAALVLRPGTGIVRRLDVSGHMVSGNVAPGHAAPALARFTGCGGPHGVLLSLFDAETDRAVFLEADADLELRPFFTGRGAHDLAQTRDGVLAIESCGRRVRWARNYDEVLFTVGPQGFETELRMTSLDPDTLLVYGRDLMVVYALSGRELLRASLKHYTEAYSCLGNMDREWGAAGRLCIMNVYEPRVHVLEAWT